MIKKRLLSANAALSDVVRVIRHYKTGKSWHLYILDLNLGQSIESAIILR
jgi:hypothetical protein